MRILEMVEEIEQQAEAAGGYELIAPPGWTAATTPDADLHWRAAPHPMSGALFQDPDFSYPTVAGPLAFRLFYYSGNAGTDSEYGSGRRASWPLRLTSDGTTVTVMHDDGVDRQYRNDGTSHFAVIGPPSGDTLTYDAVNGWDETRGDTGYKFHFPVGNYVSLAYRATPQGMFITCNYDTNHRLQSLVEPAGRLLTFSYNGDGRVQLVQDWGYRQDTVLTYVGSDLTEVWEPNGAVTQYRYDSSHRMTAVYDPMGYGTTYTYDSSSRVLTRSVAGNLGLYTYVSSGPALQTGYTDPLGNTWTHLSNGGIPTGQIDPLGNRQTYVYQICRPVAITNALGYTTTYSYDVYGFPTGRQDALGNRWTYTRDSGAHVVLTAQDALGYVTTYAWGANALLRQLQAITDPLGNIMTYSYLASGLPQYRQNQLGYVTTYTWTGQALLSAETNPLGCMTTYLYDVGTNRVGVIDALGDQRTYGFDALRRRVSVQNPLGAIATTLYDARGKVQAEQNALGCLTTYLWNAYGDETVQMNALGCVSTTIYNSKGNMSASINPLGGIMTLVRDVSDAQIGALDPFGYRTTTVHDATGRAVAIVDALANRTTFVYDQAGRQLASVDALGRITTTVFNALSRPVAFLDALANRTTRIYDAAGRMVAAVDALGRIATRVYDAAGRTVAYVDPLGNCSTVVYDAASQQIATVDALGRTATTVNDATGAAIAVVNPLGYRTTTTFDAAGRAVALTDANGRMTTTIYDLADRVAAETDALGLIATYALDVLGRRIATLDARGNRTTWQYDGAGNATGPCDALGNRTTMTYDVASRQIKRLDARNLPTTYTYDALSRLNGIQYNDATRVTLSFDPLGNRTAMQDTTGATTYLYDPLYHISQVVCPDNRSLTYLYDSVSNRAVLVDRDGGRTTYSHDAADRLVSLLNPLNERTTWQYDALGRTVTLTMANGVRTTYSYDAVGNTVRLANLKSDLTVLSSFDYTFDPVGCPLSVGEVTGARVTWSYDALYQLTREHRSGATAFDITHVYDPVGNPTVKVDTGSFTTCAYDAANRVLTQVTGAVTTTVTCDANGNMLVSNQGGARTTFTWDGENRPTLIALPTGGYNTMAYSGDGKRWQRQDPSGTTRCIWDEETVLQETDATGTTTANYSLSDGVYGDLLSQRRSGAGHFYLYDAIGSTAALADSSQAITDSYVYTAYGDQKLASGATVNPYRWIGRLGYVFDGSVGLYLLRARYYDPGSLRFLSSDPACAVSGEVCECAWCCAPPLGVPEQSRSRQPLPYRYAANSATRFVDPGGHAPTPAGQAGSPWVVLDVPWHKEKQSGYCGRTSQQMVVEYFTGHDIHQIPLSLANLNGNLLRYWPYQTPPVYERITKPSLDGVGESIQAGCPAIVYTDFWAGAHIFVLTSYNPDTKAFDANDTIKYGREQSKNRTVVRTGRGTSMELTKSALEARLASQGAGTYVLYIPADKCLKVLAAFARLEE